MKRQVRMVGKVRKVLCNRLKEVEVGGDFRLENGTDPKGWRNEQVAQSKAECQSGSCVQDDCLYKRIIGANGEEGSSPPSFLVLNKDNVNARFLRARGLITMWDFLEYKGRIGRMHVILVRKMTSQRLK